MPINNIPDTPRRLVKIPAPDVSGRYWIPSSSFPNSGNVLGNNTLRAYPFVVSFPLVFDRIGGEVTVAGEAGSKIRLGLYSDSGRSVPGDLLVDAGQLDGTSATVQDLVISPLYLDPGIYWAAAVVQSAPTTQPTVRTCGALDALIPIIMNPTSPSAGISPQCYIHTGGAPGVLPSTFAVASNGGFSGVSPLRHHFRCV